MELSLLLHRWMYKYLLIKPLGRDTLQFCERQPKTTAIGKSLQLRLLRGSRVQALDYRCNGREVRKGSVFIIFTPNSLIMGIFKNQLLSPIPAYRE